MPVSPLVTDVFAHFHNLNLLVLLEDLRHDRTARHAWLFGPVLCPVAHGLQDWQVRALGQTLDLGAGADFAARHLGTDPEAVRRFVRAWDDEELSTGSLLRQLGEVWAERLDDAEAVQELLCPHQAAAT